ncbi:phosphoribosylglycinamide formyltransferase [Pseudoxanthomonas sp. JBR18]|uniref:phosphoribosylglycinamide formyltransferase n=1 Tax=Pseudoxanthomonas sp. JBR18 TaxID=2969308 RepID=UPI002306AD03|nr:phosphoribosylglycinamide formyltransferase [Pseudoxanthomonas sp. JBR18]WCE04364.1 phosphoribosylglycinamide formyltransferase [Pseudoxanthomonas sp. JBR18]
MSHPRIAVLASGRGSNLQAILDAIASGALRARLAGVFSDRPQAAALHRVPAALRWSAKPASFESRDAYEQALGDAIAASGADWIVCAGYMRILGDALIQRFAGRMLNIHPSLLPRHRGLGTHAAALAAGDAEHGCSVHFVIPELDAGTVIAQARLAIAPGETPERLAQRVLALEHLLLPATLKLAVSGRLAERGGTALVDGQPMFTPLTLDSTNGLAPLPRPIP